jgi:hypothetical protein
MNKWKCAVEVWRAMQPTEELKLNWVWDGPTLTWRAKYRLKWPNQRHVVTKEATLECAVVQAPGEGLQARGFLTTTEVRHPFFRRESKAVTMTEEDAKAEAVRECVNVLWLAVCVSEEEVQGEAI